MNTRTTHLSPTDSAYPALLATIPSPPTLALRGSLVPGDALAIAIVARVPPPRTASRWLNRWPRSWHREG